MSGTLENVERVWMYNRLDGRGALNSKFITGVDNFLQFARSQQDRMSGENIGEHRKRMAIRDGREPTPSALHLHVHTHGNDGKNFVGERSRIVHERYEEIVQQQTQTQSEVNQIQAYYEAVGGENKRRVFGLGSQAQLYYGPSLRVSSESDASSSVPPPSAQSTPMGNFDELISKLIPALTDHMLPVLAERVREMISSPSQLPNALTDRSSAVAPDAPAAIADKDDLRPSGSDSDHNPPT